MKIHELTAEIGNNKIEITNLQIDIEKSKTEITELKQDIEAQKKKNNVSVSASRLAIVNLYVSMFLLV